MFSIGQALFKTKLMFLKIIRINCSNFLYKIRGWIWIEARVLIFIRPLLELTSRLSMRVEIFASNICAFFRFQVQLHTSLHKNWIRFRAESRIPNHNIKPANSLHLRLFADLVLVLGTRGLNHGFFCFG